MNRTLFSEELERRCGKPAAYFSEMKADEGPAIGIVGFDDYPLPCHSTYFTHGLHLLNRPEWTHGRPEYYITIDNGDRDFALFFAYLISAFAFEKVMGWNTLIGAGDTDAIEGYPYRRIALGPPQYLDWDEYQFKEANFLPINFGMAYFVSNDDFLKAAKTGFGYLEEKLTEDYDYWRTLQRS